jgi:hypothetical protein
MISSNPKLRSYAKIADHAALMRTPNFWDPKKAYAWYDPDIEGAFLEGVNYRRQKLSTAAELREKGRSNIAMLTDLQSDFREHGRLPVNGTDTVVLHTAVRLLNGTIEPYYTGIVLSQGGHPELHISYAIRWQHEDGSQLILGKIKLPY